MMQEFAKSGHPVFRSSSPLSRGVLVSMGGERSSIHYTVVSINQLSICRAAVVWNIGEREGANVNPNENRNISQDLVTKLTRHEPPDFSIQRCESDCILFPIKISSGISRVWDKYLAKQDFQNL